MQLYGLFGAGGFGREVMPLAQQALRSKAEEFELVFVVEGIEDETLINGHRVIPAHVFIDHDAQQKFFNVAIADSRARERIANAMTLLGIPPFSISAPSSLSLASNTIGEGAIFCPFTTVGANAQIGRFFHSNLYSYVAHDCAIGDFVTFAPNVICNGKVVIEDHAYLGAGAVIKQGTKDKPTVIGKGAVIGMGSVVTKDVPPFMTVVGNPAAELQK